MELRDLAPEEAAEHEKRFRELVEVAQPKRPVRGSHGQADTSGIQSWLQPPKEE